MDRACYDTESGSVYCTLCAPDDLEPEAHPQETDAPTHCCNCGRPVQYSLTKVGVQYVIEAILDTLEEGTDEWNKVRETDDYYHNSRSVDVVRDWAEDLKNYNLSRKDKFLVDHFLEVTRENPERPSQ